MQSTDRSMLARPLELPNGFVIPNRLAKAALSEGLGDRDGAAGSRIQRLYRRWAGSGVGRKLLDNLTELTYYSVQMWRMAKGKEPAPDRHAAINVSQYLLNNGFESLRSPRA